MVRGRARTLLPLLVALTACGSAEDRAAEHRRRAERYEREGERGKAVLELASALEQQDDADSHERLGGLLMRQGAPEQAANHFRRAHELDPTRVSAIVSELYLVAAGDRARGGELLAKAEAVAPDSAPVFRARSELALLDRDPDAAIAAARRAAELAPEDPESHVQLGRVHQLRIREQQALGRAADAALLQPALAAFERADQLGKGNVSLRLERARLYASWPGHDAEARAAYEDAIGLAQQQGAADLQIVALHAYDDFARARGDASTRERALRGIAELDPAKLSVWRDLAGLLAGQENALAALFAELLAARGDDPDAHRLYASHLLATGRDQQAVDHLKEATEQLGAPALFDELIQLHLLRLQLPQARRAFERLAAAHPEDPTTQRAAARLALAEGSGRDAALAVSRIPADRRGPDDFRLLALAEEQSGNLDAAQAAIAQAGARADGFAEGVARIDARLRCARRDFPGCLAALRELARRRLPLDTSEQLASMQALAATGRGDLADKLLEKLLSQPEPPAAVVLEFARQRGARQPKRAEELLRAAEARAPGDPLLVRALTDLWRHQGRPETALEHLNQSIGAGASNPAVLLLRAEILVGMNELERAESDALRAFEAAPGLAGAVDLLVDIYARQDRLAQARKSFAEAEAAGVLHPGGRLLLARLRAQAGETAAARALLESLLAERPHMHSAMSELARLLADAGVELERAQQLALQAAAARRSSRSAAHAAGYVYLRGGRFEAALGELERARELPEPLGRDEAAELHYHLGLALGALSRNADARRELEQALSLDPGFRGAEDARKKLAELARAG